MVLLDFVFLATHLKLIYDGGLFLYIFGRLRMYILMSIIFLVMDSPHHHLLFWIALTTASISILLVTQPCSDSVSDGFPGQPFDSSSYHTHTLLFLICAL